MKEKYSVYTQYVEDRGLGVNGNCDCVLIASFDNEEEAIKEFNDYLDLKAVKRYTFDDYPYHELFNELSITKETFNEELEEWEDDDLYYGSFLAWYKER